MIRLKLLLDLIGVEVDLWLGSKSGWWNNKS